MIVSNNNNNKKACNSFVDGMKLKGLDENVENSHFQAVSMMTYFLA